MTGRGTVTLLGFGSITAEFDAVRQRCTRWRLWCLSSSVDTMGISAITGVRGAEMSQQYPHRFSYVVRQKRCVVAGARHTSALHLEQVATTLRALQRSGAEPRELFIDFQPGGVA